MTNNEAILPSELIYYYNNHLGIYKIFAAKDYPDGKPLKEGKLEVPKINPIPIDFPVEIDCRTTSPEGDWMKEAFEQFRGMAVFDGNADEIPKYLYTYFKEAIQDNIPKPEGDVVEKILDEIMKIDMENEGCEVERHEDYKEKHRQILIKHLGEQKEERCPDCGTPTKYACDCAVADLAKQRIEGESGYDEGEQKEGKCKHEGIIRGTNQCADCGEFLKTKRAKK